MSEVKAWEKMTIAEQMSAARDRQASFRLEAEVRAAGRARNLDAKEVDGLVERARAAFVFVNGEARAVEADRKTPVRREDGGFLTVPDWVHLSLGPSPLSGEGGSAVATFGPSPVVLPDRVGNPWRKKTWNLTEQMRIQRRDPELAAKLKAAA